MKSVLLTLAAALLLATVDAHAIRFGQLADKPYHLTIGQEFEGTLLAFETDLNVPGVGAVEAFDSATYYKSDAYGNGYAWTAKHNFTFYLGYDPNAVFSLATGSNFYAARGYEFAITGYEYNPDLDVVIMKFTLGPNEPGFLDNTIGTAVPNTLGIAGGFGIPKTVYDPQPPDDGGALGGSAVIGHAIFSGLSPESHVSTTRSGGPSLQVNLTPGDSGCPLVAPYSDPGAPKEILGIGIQASTDTANYVRADAIKAWSDDWIAAQAPEPGSAVLVVVGGAAFGFRRLRQRRGVATTKGGGHGAAQVPS